MARERFNELVDIVMKLLTQRMGQKHKSEQEVFALEERKRKDLLRESIERYGQFGGGGIERQKTQSLAELARERLARELGIAELKETGAMSRTRMGEEGAMERTKLSEKGALARTALGKELTDFQMNELDLRSQGLWNIKPYEIPVKKQLRGEGVLGNKQPNQSLSELMKRRLTRLTEAGLL